MRRLPAFSGRTERRRLLSTSEVQEEVVTKPRRISYNCPVCGGFVRTLFDPPPFVECEDDDGTMVFFHPVCYDKALEATE
jgi:hypothetical protein